MKNIAKITGIICLLCIGWWNTACKRDCQLFAEIHGKVIDEVSGTSVSNASVTLSPLNITQQTQEEGFFCFTTLDVQTYTLIVQQPGYEPNRKTVPVISREKIQVDITLTPINKE